MRRLLPALLLVIAACGDASSRGPLGGTVVVATAADADATLPPLVRSSQGRFASELLFDRLAEIGPSLNTIGDADVVAGYRALMDSTNGASTRAELADIAAVTADGERRVTASFRTRAPEQFYVTSLIFPLPAHLLPADGSPLATSALARTPVGSGPFRFVAWEPMERLELAAVDDYYRGRARLDRVIVTVSPEPATGLAKIWAEEADVWELVPAGDLAEATSHPHLRLVLSNAFDYPYVAFNFRDARNRERPHPLFSDAALRRAIAHAVNREEAVSAVFDTLAFVANAPTVHAQFTFDSTVRPIPHDSARAAAILDSLGWRVDPRDGIRRRGAQRLTFTALVPGSSRNRERMAVLLQEQLRQAGIAMEIERAENRTFTLKREAGEFDVVFGGWLTVPSPRSLTGTWMSATAPGQGTRNDGRWSNADFDAAVMEGISAMDRNAARRAFSRAYQTIADDVPALFLYEPRIVAAVHRRFVTPAWRPDGWWRTLHEWSVDPAQRLPRDARPAN